MHSQILGSRSGRGAEKSCPCYCRLPVYLSNKREWGVGYRWTVSQRGNVDDRDLGISAFDIHSYHPKRMVLDHVKYYRKDSGGGFRVGQNPVDIKYELTNRYFRLPSTLLIQYGEAR